MNNNTAVSKLFNFEEDSSFRTSCEFSSTRTVTNSEAAKLTQTGNFEQRRVPLIFEGKVLDFIAQQKESEEAKIVEQLENEIRIMIQQDEFVDGEISSSELYMKNALSNNQIKYIMKALMNIYSSSLLNPGILEGVLVMISSVSYEAVLPYGQVMALGLLSNRELIIRDRAIQCFEQWNSKKGLDTLKSLACSPKWLQQYVDKVIMYIERNGID